MSLARYKYRNNSRALRSPKKGFPLGRILLLFMVLVLVWHKRAYFYAQGQILFSKTVAEIELDDNIEAKIPTTQTFKLRQGWWQKSWIVNTVADAQWVCDHSPGVERCQMVRELTHSHGAFAGGVIDFFSKDSLGELLMVYWKSAVQQTRLAKYKTPTTHFWQDLSTGCVWKEPCPAHPLEGGAVPIGADFDFLGREYLFAQDLFVGIGESPVFAMLAGSVKSVDSVENGWAITINHGGGVLTRSAGLSTLNEGLAVAQPVAKSQLLGRLSARDTTEFTVQIMRNGRFVRWADFHQESYPLDDKAFARFLRSLDM